MENYLYTLDSTLIEISSADDDSHYEVYQQNVPIGYIYVSELDDDTGRPIWNGSTPYLNLVAPQIGVFIEECES